MVKFLIGSLLLSAVFSVVICDKPDAKKIITGVNQFLIENNLTEVSLGEFLITPILFNEGRIRSLNTLELQDESEIDESQEEDGVRYNYNLNIGIKNMTIKYRFSVELPIVHPSGIISFNVGKNSFYADGHVFIAKNGSCSAVLHDAGVNSLTDYEIRINPKDIMIPFERRYFEGVINKIFHERLASVVYLTILGKKLPESFDKKFSNVICSEIQKN